MLRGEAEESVFEPIPVSRRLTEDEKTYLSLRATEMCKAKNYLQKDECVVCDSAMVVEYDA